MDTATITPAKQASSDLHASIEQVQGQLVEIDKISAGLAAIEKAHPKDVACAVSTVAGMKQAIAGRAAWRDPRVALEKVRKAAKAPVLALGRDIDTFARSLEIKLLEGENHYDDQIKAEEARKEAERQEKARKEAERIARIRDGIHESFTSVPAMMDGSSAAELGEEIQRVVAMEITPFFQELAQEASDAKDKALATLRKMQEKAADRELEEARLAAEKEELARQKKARDEERAKLEQERQAIATQRAAAEAEHQRMMQEERARRQREEDEIRAKREEQDRADRARRDEEDRLARQARAAEDARLARERAALEELQRKAREAEDQRQAEVLREKQARAAAEQARLDAEAAERRRVEDEEAEARRKAKEAEWQAAVLVAEAAPRMLAIFRRWQAAEASRDKVELQAVRVARDELLGSLQ